MTIAAILGAITALGTIVGGIVYLVKYSTWALHKTPDQTNQDIDKQEQANKQKAQQTGRPE